MAGEPGGPRREDMREAIGRAAVEVFEEYGFARGSTRQIADTAGVAEALVFRYYGTKAALFNESVRQRFEAAIARFEVEVMGEGDVAAHPANGDVRARRFLHQLCEFVVEYRSTLLVLTTVDSFESGGEEARVSTRASIGRLRALVDRFVLRDADGRARPALDQPLSASGVLALVLGMLVLDESIYADAEELPAVSSSIEEIVAMVLYGVSHRGRRARSANSTA